MHGHGAWRQTAAEMASSSFSRSSRPWSLAPVLAVMLTAIMTSAADGAFSAQPWQMAHATFYGDDSAAATIGGACGYGNPFSTGYGASTAALSSVLFLDGFGCGQCFDIRCTGSALCNSGSPIVTITATNLCPANWALPSDNGGWCNPPRVHFDLSKPAFEQIADWVAGIVPVMYRRVPCPTTGGVRFLLQGNGYWLLVYVMNVGGSGDVASLEVKGDKMGWIAMSHNWGASYQAFSQLGGQSLSFRILSYTSQETLVAYDVVPAGWGTGLTYEADVNFA